MKNIIKLAIISFAAAFALTACFPDDDHSLGGFNITQDMVTFNMTPGSDEFTYNFAVTFSEKLACIFKCEISFGDGKTGGELSGSHEYIVYAGSYTATCLITLSAGNVLIKTQPITIANDNPKALVDDPTSLQYALTGGKNNVNGKTWRIGPWSAMRNPDNRNDVWWAFGENEALQDDKFIFMPDNVFPNGAFRYENNGNTFMNQALNGLFPEGNDPENSFVTEHYTPPTDATWEFVVRDGKTILVINKGFLGYPTAPAELDKTEYEVIEYSTTNIRLILASGWNGWCYELTCEAPPLDPLTGAGSKTWVVDSKNTHLQEVKDALPDIAGKLQGHMGLGSINGGYQEWWGAAPGDKTSSFPMLYSTTYTFASTGQLTIVTGGEGYGRKKYDGEAFNSSAIDGDDMLFPYDGGAYTYTKTDDRLTILGNGFLVYYCGEQTYDILYLSQSALCVRVKNEGEGQDWVFILCPEGEVDGTEPPEPDVDWVGVNSNDNLWKGANITNSFYYAPGWSQIADPALTVSGTQYSLSFPEATSDQWQCQCAFLTDALTTSASEHYDFRVTINSSKEFMGATVKFVQEGDDNNYLFAPRVKLLAEENVIKMINVAGKNISQAKIVFDFGGNLANTDIVIKDIILQKHQ